MAKQTITRQEIENLAPMVGIPDAARCLSIDRNYAYKMIDKGTFPLPVVKVGQRHRVYKKDLLAAIGLEDAA